MPGLCHGAAPPHATHSTIDASRARSRDAGPHRHGRSALLPRRSDEERRCQRAPPEPVPLCVRLADAYGLARCIVLDRPEDDHEPLRAARGRVAAELLSEIMEAGD